MTTKIKVFLKRLYGNYRYMRRRLALAVLNRSPYLRALVKRIIHPRQTLNVTPTSIEQLTPSAQQIYFELQKAMDTKKRGR